MALSFFIISVFGGLAFVSDRYIKLFESKNNIIVFFDVGMDQGVIDRLWTKWGELDQIESIEFTSEDDAYALYSDYASRSLRDIYEVLIEKEEKKLPSSLDIQLKLLAYITETEPILRADIDSELEKLQVIDTQNANTEVLTNFVEENGAEEVVEEVAAVEAETIQVSTASTGVGLEEAPIELAIDSDSIDEQIETFSWLRLAGIVVLITLFIVIFFLTFMTVNFRLYNQMEEIGVMQLVGGSLAFIRAPYIIEGGFYGLLGSLVSSSILLSTYYIVFIFEVSPNLSVTLNKWFDGLPWAEGIPFIDQFGTVEIFAIVGLLAGFGFIIGALSSFLSIRRYIK
ncbi:MAG: hypothetical protein Q9M91_04925 [Candidatus Dojkabacteria bacterium]|nr:hypothetical protein [Candidatus Dojkabacteria bacterium]